MIIVNQTRDSIINFDKAQGIELVGQNIFVEFDYDGDKPQQIGSYGSEERAKEVFNELIEMLENGHIEKYRMPKE